MFGKITKDKEKLPTSKPIQATFLKGRYRGIMPSKKIITPCFYGNERIWQPL